MAVVFFFDTWADFGMTCQRNHQTNRMRGLGRGTGDGQGGGSGASDEGVGW